MIHTGDPICPGCEEKLLQADPRFGQWFRDVKKRHQWVHISWSYRGKDDQEKAFSEGKTKLHYPLSKHNHTENGKPSALALDLFEIDELGRAKYDPILYAKINAENENEGINLRWGGRFKDLGDYDHFEVN